MKAENFFSARENAEIAAAIKEVEKNTTGEIAVMGAKGAVEVISTYRKQIAEAEDKTAMTEEKIKEYEDAFNVPYRAARRGYIDDVILPSETRVRLIDAMEVKSTKSEALPAKKHGNIPL